MLKQIQFIESITQSSYQPFATMSKFLLKIESWLCTGVGMEINGNFAFVFRSTEYHISKVRHHRFQSIEIIEVIDNVEGLMSINDVASSGLLGIFEEFHITQIKIR